MGNRENEGLFGKVSDKPYAQIQEDCVSPMGLWKHVTKHSVSDCITFYTSNISRFLWWPRHIIQINHSLKNIMVCETVGAQRHGSNMKKKNLQRHWVLPLNVKVIVWALTMHLAVNSWSSPFSETLDRTWPREGSFTLINTHGSKFHAIVIWRE